MAMGKKLKWTLVIPVALAFACLYASIHNFNIVNELDGLFEPIINRTSHQEEEKDDESVSNGPWRIQNIEPLSIDEDFICDPADLSSWPAWMDNSQAAKERISNAKTSSYRSILQEYPSLTSKKQTLPLPLQILEDYRQHHSVDSVTQRPECRKFLIAYYRCPQSAGNRLHEFLNSYFWAVLLNRTLLYRYLTDAHCQRLQERFDFVNEDAQCRINNTLDDCAKILDRAPWIASYDEWQAPLGLPHDATYVNVNDFGPQSSHVYSQRGIDVAYDAVQVLAFRPMSRRYDAFGRWPKTRALKLKRNETLERVDALFSMGHRFLFGLLFRSAFDLRPEMREPNEMLSSQRATTVAAGDQANNFPFTMAIHSRHVSSKDDGCNVTLEDQCIHMVLRRVKATKHSSTLPSSCAVALMSDRPCTLKRLRSYFSNSNSFMNCSIHVANHAKGLGVLYEHGPFAGAGFFQDLFLASSFARTAVIGSSQPPHYDSWRTSSELLEELVEYHRIMEAWQNGIDPASLPELIQCGLERR
ncbi:hypothetical protein MPSEU_000406100 [Mayamaea pseudoterrestris]|nr:hypothetical protein MPSEU_000406100 [Mayamaea pseudoterrestris]